MDQDICSKLREATKKQYSRHEQNVLMRKLTGKKMTQNDYVEILQMFYGFYVPVETLLSKRHEWRDIGIEFKERKKARLLFANCATSCRICQLFLRYLGVFMFWKELL